MPISKDPVVHNVFRKHHPGGNRTPLHHTIHVDSYTTLFLSIYVACKYKIDINRNIQINIKKTIGVTAKHQNEDKNKDKHEETIH